jgi:hypothetical protein
MAQQPRVTLLAEITENNRWYARFVKAVREGYTEKVWADLIADCNSDIELFGYEYTRRRWSEFMAFHYPATKEAEVSNEEKTELFTNQTSRDGPCHAPYCLADGTIVPSVTQVLNVLNKGEAMQHWAWELGRQGLDYRAVRDSAARVGTLAHDLIASHFERQIVGLVGYSPEEVEKAKRCFAKYLAWEKDNPLMPVMIETPMVSEEYRYGGTPDLLAEINGDFVLLDFKTGGGIYDGMFAQLAAYRQLFTERGWPVAGASIIRISPDDDAYEVAAGVDLDRHWQIFLHCLEIYRLQSERVM